MRRRAGIPALAPHDDGRSLRLLVMLDEFTRECLAIRVARRLLRMQKAECASEIITLAHGSTEDRGGPF